MITLTQSAKDGSTYIVTASFYDEGGTSVVPQSLKWTLTDGAGNVVNGRSNVDIPAPSTSQAIVISGADLTLTGNTQTETRILTLEATYTSSLGAGLPLKEGIRFEVQNLIAI